MKNEYRSNKLAAFAVTIIAIVVFHLSHIGVAVVASVAYFLLVDKEEPGSGREGATILLIGTIMLAISSGLAQYYNESFLQFTEDHSTYFHGIPFYAIFFVVFGLCILLRSVITRNRK